MINKDEKLHIKYVVNIIFDGATPWNYLQTTEMGSLMTGNQECLRPDSFSATQPWFVQMLQISFEKCRFHSVSARFTFFK